MNYPTMEPAPVMVVVPQNQTPVMVVPQTETRKCNRNNRRCNKNVTPTVVTGTPAQVDAAKEEVNKYASRIHVTSVALILLGLTALVGSIYSGLNARRGAEKWLKKAMMKHQSHEAKNATMQNATMPEPETKESEYVSMAEFALVDNLRIISFLAIMISCSIIAMGKQALRASWKMNANFTKRVFRKSLMRIAFIAIVGLVIKSYVQDSVRTVQKQVGFKEFSAVNKTQKFHKKHHSRKLSELDEEDFEDEEYDIEGDFQEGDFQEGDFQQDSQMRKFMDIIKGEIKEAKETEEKEEDDNQNIETAQSHQKKELPKWMKKGMFAPHEKSSNGVTFEPDTIEEKKQNKKDKKHHKHGKKDKKHHKHGKKEQKDHKKKHHCCALFPICTLALIAGHLFQLRNLKTSLIALEGLGANMKGYKKACEEKKAAATAVVADEEQVSVNSQNIEYSFDEHIDKEEFPVVSQPSINYTINEPSTQMQ